MEEVTTHQAKTQLSSLIERVLRGEDIVICRGRQPVVRLVPVESGRETPRRPTVGTITSRPVSWTADAFAPLTDDELEAWGL
ncbi:MAG: type II toxin-antitoxin system prevent-host-death family antitoxin [Proteobacteria bacterium]|nr:type II toxin-antitoxin system prevent-host-death family antitoxin [Pseudomonadota bacterium]